MIHIKQYEGFIHTIKNIFYKKITEDEYDTIYDLFISEFETDLREYKDGVDSWNGSSLFAFFLPTQPQIDKDAFFITRSPGKENTQIEINIRLNILNPGSIFKLRKKFEKFKTRLKKFGFKSSMSDKSELKHFTSPLKFVFLAKITITK